MRTLVLGLGNTLLRDDGVAVEVARRLKRYVSSVPDIDVAVSALSGVALIDEVLGYDRLILLDAIPAAGGKVGELREIELKELHKAPSAVSPHYTGIASLIRLGQKLGLQAPKEVHVYGITVEDPFSFGEELTPEVAQAVPGIVEKVLELLGVQTTAAPGPPSSRRSREE